MSFVSRWLFQGVALLGSATLLLLTGCGYAGVSAFPPPAPGTSVSVRIPPLPGEDLVFPCSYDLRIADPLRPVLGAWVLFARADSLDLWADTAFQAEAARLRLALVYAHECDASSYADVQSDGRKGPARALAAGLVQMAAASGHPELAAAKLGLFGFSAAGVLALTTAEVMPERVMTVVTYAAGSAPLELRELTPSAAIERVPVLLLANAEDAKSGTTMVQRYFEKARVADAPWAFAVQAGVGHCCTDLAAPVLVPWMDAVVPKRLGGQGALLPADTAGGVRGRFTCVPDGVTDQRGYTDSTMTKTSVVSAAEGATADAWLPEAVTGQSWLQWVAAK